MHAWMDEAGYLDDTFTVEDVKEELDLWQPVVSDYCYQSNKEEVYYDADDISGNGNNDSLFDRLNSLLVVEDDDEEDNDHEMKDMDYKRMHYSKYSSKPHTD